MGPLQNELINPICSCLHYSEANLFEVCHQKKKEKDSWQSQRVVAAIE